MVLGIWVFEVLSIGGIPIPISTCFQLIIEILIVILPDVFVAEAVSICAFASEREVLPNMFICWSDLNIRIDLRIGLNPYDLGKVTYRL